METITLKDEFIKLGQALKLAGLVNDGADAKYFITEGHVLVNGEKEYQRGKKLYANDMIEFNQVKVLITK